MINRKNLIIAICMSLLLIACSSDNNPNTDNTPEFGNFEINFKNVVGENNVELITTTYDKNGNETFNLTELKYIISNIVLIDASGNEFVYPQADSYFLINEEFQTSKSITLQNIDANQYTSIRFGFGVDQSNYPLNGVNNFVPTAEESNMLWAWAAGYIFLRMEGAYSSPNVTAMDFKYHVGSHGTNLDNYKEISLNFLQPLAVSEINTPVLTLEMDVLQIFDSEFALNLSDKDDIQVDPENAPKIAQNMTSAFKVIMN